VKKNKLVAWFGWEIVGFAPLNISAEVFEDRKRRKKMDRDVQVAEILLRPYTWAFTLEKDRRFSARILEFPGCFAEGKSLVDAYMYLHIAAEAWVLSTLESGMIVPVPYRDRSGGTII